MTDDFETVPPPYTSDDPLRSSISSESETPPQIHTPRPHGQDRGIPSYEHVVGEDDALPFNSAVRYFEEHPAPHRRPRDGLVRHTLSLNSQSDATDVSFVPLCWQIASDSMTQDNMLTFANYLFPLPPTSHNFVHEKDWKLDVVKPESWFQRKHRRETVIAEWNEGFFRARGLYIDLTLKDDDRILHAPTSVGCAECTAASQMVLEDIAWTKSDIRLREAIGETDQRTIPTWRPMSSGRCCLSLAAGLAAQAASHITQQRSHHTSGCGGRHSHSCGSRRRRCGQRTCDPTLPVGCYTDFQQQHAPSDWLSLSPSLTLKPVPSSSQKDTHHHNDLFPLSELMADTKITTATNATDDVQNKHPRTPTSPQDIKARLTTLAAPSTPSYHLNRPRGLTLKSDVKAMKHDIKAAARQWEAERREDARARGGGGCGALSCEEKKELRRWKRESIREVRDVERSVRRAGKDCT